MKRIDKLFSLYEETHQSQLNRIIRLICVPVFWFSCIGFLMSIPIFTQKSIFVNVATLVLFFILGYYFKLSKSLCIAFTLFALFCLVFNFQIYKYNGYCNTGLAQVSTILFSIASLGLFIGYKIEGSKITLLNEFKLLLISPIWLINALYNKLGIRY